MPHEFKVGDTGLTRDGRPYRVICTDAKDGEHAFGVVALVVHRGGRYEEPIRYCVNGIYDPHRSDDRDLLPPPSPTREITRWLVAFDSVVPLLHIYPDEHMATEAASRPHSLMPDGKPHRVDMVVLERRPDAP